MTKLRVFFFNCKSFFEIYYLLFGICFSFAKDLKVIRSSNKTLTAANKLSNTYRLCKEEYSNLLQNVITSRYKKTDKHITTNIRKEGFKNAR